MTVDIEALRAWIGRRQVLEDTMTRTPLDALGALLDHEAAPRLAGSPVPPCWHWLYFLPTPRQSGIGPDGHPRRGGFLPPVPLPRRMWAASRLSFHAPLRMGRQVERQSVITDVRLKEGRTGPLVFVSVDHEFAADGQLAISERQDIVYRDAPPPHASAAPGIKPPDQAQWSRCIVPDEVLLFRYSALTLNGHRIHYDRRYATTVERYPGLVVHGPLIATLLLDLLSRNLPDAKIESFSFRAVRPTFDGAPFSTHGRLQAQDTAKLWACDSEGFVTMEAIATLSAGAATKPVSKAMRHENE